MATEVVTAQMSESLCFLKRHRVFRLLAVFLGRVQEAMFGLKVLHFSKWRMQVNIMEEHTLIPNHHFF